MTLINRRKFLTYSGAGIGSLLSAPLIGSPFSRYQIRDAVVETSYGKLKGYQQDGVSIFKGVPYAGRVSGTRRFLTPAPLEPWAGVKDATKLGNPSVQPPNQTWGIDEPESAEECLVLNIWTPGLDGKKRPVMVYNHGGGYTHGSAGSVAQDGTNLARMFDVVVVATNHRLGLLGYLYLDDIAGGEYAGSGNRGVQDIAIALKWVNENIAEFGGDPENVMIFGESGGGLKTSCLYAMPQAAPYFQKASIESGPGIRIKTREKAAETTELLLKQLDISKLNWRKLLELPAKELLSAQVKLQSMDDRNLASAFNGIGAAGRGGFGPVVDGIVMTSHPFDPKAPEISRNKPLLTGWNEDEYIFFAMYGGDKSVFKLSEADYKTRVESQFADHAERIVKTYKEVYPENSPTENYIAMQSLLIMGLGSIRIAERKATQNGAPVFLYNFGYKSENKVPDTDYEYGAMHALDIPFKFYNIDNVLDKWGNRSSGMAGDRPEKFQASKNFSEFWTSFARTGTPTAKGQPEWPAFNLEKRQLMRIDTECQVFDNRHEAEYSLWKDIFED